MPGANWNEPPTFDPGDPRNRFKRRDPKIVKSEVEAKKARDKAEPSEVAQHAESDSPKSKPKK